MPGQLCCDTASAVSRLIDASADEKVKTTGYLTLEVLYASRRLHEFGDHIDTLIRHLLQNPELPDLIQSESALQSNQRIIAYIQATAQVVLNFASNETTNDDGVMHRQILRYITLACSVLSEYLVSGSERVKNAGFSAMRMILSHGLKPQFFTQQK